MVVQTGWCSGLLALLLRALSESVANRQGGGYLVPEHTAFSMMDGMVVNHGCLDFLFAAAANIVNEDSDEDYDADCDLLPFLGNAHNLQAIGQRCHQ